MNETFNADPRIMNGEVQEVKSRVALGIVGALVGAMIGSVLWIVIYELGYVAYIAGIAIIYCSYRGYVMLSKDKAMKGVVIATIMSILVLMMVHYFCWGLDIYNEFIVDYEITLLDALISVPSFAFHPDFVVGFVKDLLIGLILIFVGAAPYFRKARKAAAAEAAEF